MKHHEVPHRSTAHAMPSSDRVRAWVKMILPGRWPNVAPGLLGIGVVMVARGLGWLQPVEWAVLDLGLRWRSPEPTDQHVVIVGIDEADIQSVGTYPIPDGVLAQLLQKLHAHQPRGIGLDVIRELPVEPGHDQFTAVLQSMDTVIGAESVIPDRSGTVIAPPPVLPTEQVGFVDALLDGDGNQRRSLLGSRTIDGDYQFAMALRLAMAYLEPHDIVLANGIRDPVAMRFDTVEIPVITPQFGGYTRIDAGGNQTLINFRSGPDPFHIVSLTDVLNHQFEPEWFRDRIVLIGITANSSKYGADVAQSTAVTSENPGLVFGVEIQAHATSQLINAVLEGRSLLHTWPDRWEYTWIFFWGLLGMGIGRIIQTLGRHLVGITVASIGLIGIGYSSLLSGWWIPIAPALGIFLFNGVVLHAFYLYNHSLQARIRDRQRVIEQTFTAIHNGPLQTLAKLLRELEEVEVGVGGAGGAERAVGWVDDRKPNNFSESAVDWVDGRKPNNFSRGERGEFSHSLGSLRQDLQQLNQDLRGIYVGMQQEIIQGNQLYLPGKVTLDLTAPLHELLYEIYDDTLQRNLPHFKGIKIRVVKFEPFEEASLSADQKRDLCRFLEEALCNVGKYAEGAKRLVLDCRYDGTENVIRVVDNGSSNSVKPFKWPSPRLSQAQVNNGRGSQQAIHLAAQLRGTFERSPQSPKGVKCELRWAPKRSLWHQILQHLKQMRV